MNTSIRPPAIAPHQHRRNGKIARLPEATRDHINVMIQDGVLYRDIIKSLAQPGSPPLPYSISESNLSQWRKGGYQEWRLRQQQLKLVRDLATHIRDTIQLLVANRAQHPARPDGPAQPPQDSEPFRT